MSNLVGAKREFFTPNPAQPYNFGPDAPVHPAVLYAIWLYSKNTNDWSYATNQYTALKAIFTTLRNSGNVRSYPELAGAIGFARIAQQLGKTADYNDANNYVNIGFTQGANFNQFLNTARFRFPNGPHSYSTPIFIFRRQGLHPAPVLHFNRDIGQFLANKAAPAVRTYTEQINKDVPLWWLTGAAFSHGENSYTPPEISWANFMLHAYVLGESPDQLKKYLDAPDRKGDLMYMQKLIAIIDAGVQ